MYINIPVVLLSIKESGKTEWISVQTLRTFHYVSTFERRSASDKHQNKHIMLIAETQQSCSSV